MHAEFLRTLFPVYGLTHTCTRFGTIVVWFGTYEVWVFGDRGFVFWSIAVNNHVFPETLEYGVTFLPQVKCIIAPPNFRATIFFYTPQQRSSRGSSADL
jgi:hypothetical protein